MSCVHDWEPRHPEHIENEARVEERVHYGSVCRHCGKLRGGEKGYSRLSILQRGGPTGEVPLWLAKRLTNGELTLRAPESVTRHDEVRALVEEGRVDATFTFNREQEAWTATWVSAPQSSHTDPIPPLRRKIGSIVPDAADWLRGATLRDLETAEAIVKVPDWRSRNWTARIWTSLVRATSKVGDASSVAARLGSQIRRRGTAQWFYGIGTIHYVNGQTDRIDGEQCIPDSKLRQIAHIETTRLNIIENRDLAAVISSGLTFALDGQPSSHQLEFLSRISRAGIDAWLWPDADAEGVRIARAVKRVWDLRVEGLDTFPLDWGIPLDDEKLRVLEQEIRIDDEYADLLHAFRDARRYWEQERLFAESEIRQTPLRSLATTPRRHPDGPAASALRSQLPPNPPDDRGERPRPDPGVLRP